MFLWIGNEFSFIQNSQKVCSFNELVYPLVIGAFGVMYDGYLCNAEDDVEGAIPVLIKTVKG